MKEQLPIIAPVDRKLIQKELTEEVFIRHTRKGENEIYSVNYHNSPNILQEIGRLRELSFRKGGGGTGNSIDLDDYDKVENCYEQLIVWSPEDQEIIGGYRYIKCATVPEKNGKFALSTNHYFDFSEKFAKNYLPTTVELGRSWVQPQFQPSINPRKGLFALDNILDGLGAIVVNNPEIEYFFGKVTMYPSYDRESRDFLLYFMHYYFPDNEKLITAYHPLEQESDVGHFDRILQGLDFKEGFKVLKNFVRERGEFVPPLVNLYMHLSPSMKTFGTAVNPEFGSVEETAILVKIADIFEEKKVRHLEGFEKK